MDDDPPLVLDIDGTLTRPDDVGLDPRLFDVVREWDAPVVLATGKAFPYPVALCDFIGIEHRVIAETGGIVYANDDLAVNGDGEEAWAVAEAFREAGYDLGWPEGDMINRWRETEVAIATDAPGDVLREIAADYGLEIVDSGYAYHVKSPDVNKGQGVETVADLVGIDPESFVAIGDSENDVSTFDVVGRSFAVANADDRAKRAADVLVEGAHADGTLEALERVRAER
jgi:phosphoglycolate phosphatase (TIGR01487 family)